MDRRKFISASALGIAGGGICGAMPAWARGGHGAVMARKGSDVLSGQQLTMTVADASFSTGPRHGHAVTVNGTIPGPLLRLKEGQKLAVNLVNNSADETSIHWHGLLVPFLMDGVPGVTMAAVKPGETFRYEFPIRQAGTYWWHAHTMQEPMGHYGPIIIDPATPQSHQYEAEYVLMLSDWSPMHPHMIMKKLKVGEGYFNHAKTSATDDYPLSAAQRRMWARMRMMPTDIADVTGSTYSYLINGHGPADGLELAFKPGERIRLRIINGAAMTFFNFRIPGLPMTVIAADGQDVEPVEVDEFQIGNAETYDVIITPRGADAFAVIAEAMDRSGMGVAMLCARPGQRADVPGLRPPPLLSMADMGMGHGSHGQDDPGAMAGMNHGPAGDAGADNAAAGHAGAGHVGAGHVGAGHVGATGRTTDAAPAPPPAPQLNMPEMNMRDTSLLPANVTAGPGLDMVSANPQDRMGYPGLGLENAGHRVLNYRQLAAARPNPEQRAPTRLRQIHLTGNMERYMWSFDGRKYSALTDEPIRFAYNERVRIRLVNDTMMAHPIHLHGHFFELVNGHDGRQPLKHTLIVQPGSSAAFDLTANEPGDWAFHCHLMYHMHSGMFQVVTVRPLQ